MSRAAFLVCKAAFFGVELLPRLKNAAIGPSSFFFFFFKSYPWLCLKNPSSSLPKVAFYLCSTGAFRDSGAGAGAGAGLGNF